MLKGFSVTNFKSFHKPQTLSLVATKIVRHSSHVVSVDGQRILKSSLIFGANASGKTNLIQAVDFSRRIIIDGLQSVDLTNKHFRIANGSFHEPGVFEYAIVLGDHEYSYGIAVAYDKHEIVSEWLIRKDSTREFVLFDRRMENGKSTVETDIQEDEKENNRIRVYLEDFGPRITDTFRRRTILSDITTRAGESESFLGEIRSVYSFFVDMIILFPSTEYIGINEAASTEPTKNFFEKMLAYFDTGIESLADSKKQADFSKLFPKIPQQQADSLKIQISNSVPEKPLMMRYGNNMILFRKDSDGNVIYHKLMLNHGNGNDLFDYADESDGTRRLFDLIPLLSEQKNSHVILVDEIDRSLHANLVRQFIQTFFDFTEGKPGQLIATTQSPIVMDLELLRQDEIWFVEREDDHSSRLYSLNKFKERFDKVVRNDYLIGRYGAIPIFRQYFLDGSDNEDNE